MKRPEWGDWRAERTWRRIPHDGEPNHVPPPAKSSPDTKNALGPAMASAFSDYLKTYFFTISAFSNIEMPPLLTSLPLSVTVLAESGASSSLIGLWEPITR